MELGSNERKAVSILLRCRELERDSKIVSKAKGSGSPREELFKELRDPDRFTLEFIHGTDEELRGLLAKLSVYAKVLSDISDLNLVEAYESAAVKLKKKGLIPRLVLKETTAPRIETAERERQPAVNVDKQFEQLRLELWEPIRRKTAQLLREEHPLLFVDPKVEKIADRLIDRSLEEEFKERRKLAEEFASESELRNIERLRETVRYVLEENMKYWVKHWAIEEIDHELKEKRK